MEAETTQSMEGWMVSMSTPFARPVTPSDMAVLGFLILCASSRTMRCQKTWNRVVLAAVRRLWAEPVSCSEDGGRRMKG